MEIKTWSENIIVENGCDHSGLRTLAVSQKLVIEIDWFFGVLINIQESQKLL